MNIQRDTVPHDLRQTDGLEGRGESMLDGELGGHSSIRRLPFWRLDSLAIAGVRGCFTMVSAMTSRVMATGEALSHAPRVADTGKESMYAEWREWAVETLHPVEATDVIRSLDYDERSETAPALPYH